MDIPGSDPRLHAKVAERVAGLGERGSHSMVPDGIPQAFAADALRRLAARLAETEKARPRPVDPKSVDVLCEALLSGDDIEVGKTLTDFGLDNASPDHLYEAVFAAAARELGQRWTDDRLSFVDVTLGMGRLQALVRDIGQGFGHVGGSDPDAPFAIFAPVPGELHTFGLSLASDYFQRAGWRVDLLGDVGTGALVAEVQARGPGLVGLTAGGRPMLGVLRKTIAALRASGAQALICVGGPLVDLEPDIAKVVDADAKVQDAASAAILLRTTIRKRALEAM